MADRLDQATARLEAAVERLAAVAARPRNTASEAEVAELSRRLDATLARLRLALARDEAEDSPEEPDELAESLPDEAVGETAGQGEQPGQEPGDTMRERGA
ncbi:hypothetical protein LPC08_08510 [Roseomonas sp. OT10]|uniref:hypothetical protein n=1 Tax=Roseomonas cutis TaxID=2897332 RepID=UPI001E2F66E0|nr:hypothetical protein [Roseomonas sp. OT10]UFN50643.1 hypothetical protein LPC08_08510 [Roseomonas sp. OT10]